jgi:hypothetical protein
MPVRFKPGIIGEVNRYCAVRVAGSGSKRSIAQPIAAPHPTPGRDNAPIVPRDPAVAINKPGAAVNFAYPLDALLLRALPVVRVVL